MSYHLHYQAIVAGLLSPAIALLTVQLPPVRSQLPPGISGSDIGQPGQTIGAGTRYGLEFPGGGGDIGQPENTVGAGTRGTGDCIARGEKPLTALMPTHHHTTTTVSANPTLFAYIPQTIAQEGELVIVDEDGEEVYSTYFGVQNPPGVIKLNLPSTIALEPDQEYQWQLALICNPQQRELDKFVRGSLRRRQLSPEMQNQLAKVAAEPIEQAKIYLQASIWQDALTLIDANRDKYPGAWEELLQSVGLGAVGDEPMIDCCKAIPEN